MTYGGHMTANEYMTVQEAADLAHVDHQTVRRWFRENRLGRYRIGPRRVLVKRSEIEAMIHRDLPVSSPDRTQEV
jgi:excisionase family DNA binding protein